MRFLSRSLVAFSLAVLLVLSGCEAAKRGVVVRGKLLKGGQPAQVDITGRTFPPGETGRMSMVLYPVKADNESIVNEKGAVKVPGGFFANIEADGTFVVGAGKESGIPPGKYRIVIIHNDPNSGADLLRGAFNEVNSKITRDVNGEQEVVIDLAKPQG